MRRLFAAVLAVGTLTFCAEEMDESGRDDLTDDAIPQQGRGLRKDRGGTSGDFDYCNGTITCNPGEGDCDSNAECNGGAVCGHDNGPNFGMPGTWDVCVLPHCTNHTQDALETGVDCGGADCGSCGGPTCGGANGDFNFCSTSCPCGQVGQGDCDDDSQCTNGLVCKSNVGASFGMPADYDNCVAAHCRNGTVDGGETGLDCGSPDCNACVTPPNCGNGVRNSGEACDDGNTFTETSCPTGQMTCVACNANCSAVLMLTGSGPGAVCGNNVVEAGEACDDGNTFDEFECAYGTATCTGCDSTCQNQLDLTGNVCGDAVVGGPEQCDDGTPGGDGCDSACTLELVSLDPFGQIEQWMVLGLFSNSICGVETTEAIDEHNTSPRLGQLEGGATWTESNPGCHGFGCGAGGYDLDCHWGGDVSSVFTYLFIYVHNDSGGALAAQLRIGSDDGLIAVFNGSTVTALGAENACRPCGIDQNQADLLINPGANRLLVKVGENGGGYAAYVRLTDTNGDPLPFVTTSYSP